jgi:hypothetical protein
VYFQSAVPTNQSAPAPPRIPDNFRTAKVFKGPRRSSWSRRSVNWRSSRPRRSVLGGRRGPEDPSSTVVAAPKIRHRRFSRFRRAVLGGRRGPEDPSSTVVAVPKIRPRRFSRFRRAVLGGRRGLRCGFRDFNISIVRIVFLPINVHLHPPVFPIIFEMRKL